MLLIFNVKIIGNIRAISTSKIKKMIAIKKNRRENGIRAELKGSNPHSKGDDFSRSYRDFFEINEASSITTNAIIKIIVMINNSLNIIYIIR